MRLSRSWIPNAFTQGNLLCGVAVLVGVVEAESGALLLWVWGFGLLCDVVDGALARALGVAGPLGVQLDSLADVVTSGVVPAVVAWSLAQAILPEELLFLGAAGGTMAAAAAYRLARFNVGAGTSDAAHRGFSGLPAPAGAVWWMATWAMQVAGAPMEALAGAWVLGVTAVPLIMVSRMPLPDFKGWGKDAAWDRFRRRLLGAMGAVLVVAMGGIAAGKPLWWGGAAGLAVLCLYAGSNRVGRFAERT